MDHTCIWCIQQKPDDAFNIEHVVPQAFGTFEQNLTLHLTVCADCNSLFSRELEPWLARDTLEGFDRYEHGQKAAMDFKSMGTQSTARVQLSEGPFAGAWGYATSGDGRLGARAFPQVGFARQASGPFEWFPLTDLPTKDDLKSKGYAGDVHVRFCECSDLDGARRLLAAKGLLVGDTDTFDPPSGLVTMEHVFRPTVIHRRGFAKIALNYVAHQAGKEIVLQPRFDAIRDFVLTGAEPNRNYYELDEHPIIEGDKEATRWDGHIIVARSRGDRVEAIVSLYNRLRHGFHLAWTPGQPVGPFGHFFDIKSRVIATLQPVE